MSVAEESGWERLYQVSAAFRERFDEMAAAVEALPVHLIERGRELGYPQLHWACVAGDAELVDGLLLAGLPADCYTYTEDEDDEPPLVWLAREEGLDSESKIKVAKILLLRGASIDEGSPLIAAVEADDEDFAEFLREEGAED